MLAGQVGRQAVPAGLHLGFGRGDRDSGRGRGEGVFPDHIMILLVIVCSEFMKPEEGICSKFKRGHSLLA